MRAEHKLGFVNGSLEKPNPSSEEFDSWDITNSMIVSWIYSSLDKSLQGSLTYIDDARRMWLELKEHYSQGNAQWIHELKKEICRLEQGGDFLAVYYTKLKALWDELDEYVDVYEYTCAAATKQARDKEVEKPHHFLMGIDTTSYGRVCSRILNAEPLPSVNKAFSIVNQEEKRRAIPTRDEHVEGAAFAVNDQTNPWLQSATRAKGSAQQVSDKEKGRHVIIV